MRVVVSVRTVVCVVLLAAAGHGCAGSHRELENHGGSAGSSAGGTGAAGSSHVGAAGHAEAQCPRPLREGEPYALDDQCGACHGLECTGESLTCETGWHASGGRWFSRCQCVEGHMLCCGGSLSSSSVPTCDYRFHAKPACPQDMPLTGAACGAVPLYCTYPNACCYDGEAVAYCGEGTWQLNCLGGYVEPATSPQCDANTAGAANVPNTAGAAGSPN